MPTSHMCDVCGDRPAEWRCTTATDASGPVGHVRCTDCAASTAADFERLSPCVYCGEDASPYDEHTACVENSIAAYDRHCAGANRCANVIGLISADHPQLWTQDALVTRTAETLREDHGYSWRAACTRAERIYAGTVLGSYIV